jgi:DNA-binding transcriptional LysR family regulator
MDRLQSMKVFEQVVAEKGFAAGARKLGVSPAMVTRQIKDLENSLHVQLLRRTTRRLALTAAGETFLERVRGILRDIEAAEEAAHDHALDMAGRVRVLSLPGLDNHLVAPAMAEFHRRHPKVTIELRCDPRPARAIESHDITLLVDHVPLPADTVVRRIVDTHAVLCASPDYLVRRGAPCTPQELRDHAFIDHVLPDVARGALRLVDANDGTREEAVHVGPALTCNDQQTVLRSTLEGAGISSQPMVVAAPLLRTGQLRRVLAPWICGQVGLVAAFARDRHMPARVRAFLNHLVEHAQQSRAGIEDGMN